MHQAVDLTDGHDEFVSPPREWPACFKTAELQTLVTSDAVKAKRVRLTASPSHDQWEQVADVAIVEGDALGNATRLRARLGWQMLGGFILVEKIWHHGEYVFVPHWWNATPKGQWVDVTPRRADHASLVLIESAKTAVPEPTDEERATMAAAAKSQTEGTVPAQTQTSVRSPALGGRKGMAQVAAMEAKASRKAQFDALPADSIYTPLLRQVEMLPHEVVNAMELSWSGKSLLAHHMEQFAALCEERGPLRVKRLYLNNNAIHDKGLVALAPALATSMPGLACLYLSFNHVGDLGIEALCRTPPPQPLERFMLHQNDLGNRGYEALGNAFASGRFKVDNFVVNFCEASHEAAERLKMQCERAGMKADVKQ